MAEASGAQEPEAAHVYVVSGGCTSACCVPICCACTTCTAASRKPTAGRIVIVNFRLVNGGELAPLPLSWLLTVLDPPLCVLRVVRHVRGLRWGKAAAANLNILLY